MSKIIKNLTDSSKVYAGLTILAGQSYNIPALELVSFQNSDKLLSDLLKEPAEANISCETTPTQFLIGTDAINFLFDHQLKDDKGRCVITGTIFGVNEFRFRGKGIKGICPAGQTIDLDLVISDYTQYINGGIMILENHHTDDKITFQVVHPTYGVLDEFVTDWGVDPSINTQSPLLLKYIAKLPVGLILRIKYTSAGSSDVVVKMNYHLQKDY